MRGYKKFIALRRMVLDAIDKIDMSYGHKSYESTFELNLIYPSYFEERNGQDEPDFCEIVLHCYVLGPHRHYRWRGKTIEEAVNKCEHDVKSWIKEDQTET